MTETTPLGICRLCREPVMDRGFGDDTGAVWHLSCLAAEHERASIVAWLKDRAEECPKYEDWGTYLRRAAEEIERGEHVS